MRRTMLFLFALPFFFLHCSDNPVEPEDHAEAVGFALLVNGTENLRLLSGESGDTLTLQNGASTPLYDVRFVAEDGDLFIPDEEGSALDVVIADTSLAGIVTIDPATWTFSLEGKSPGETTLEVLILHGGHADFRSDRLVVVVRP